MRIIVEFRFSFEDKRVGMAKFVMKNKLVPPLPNEFESVGPPLLTLFYLLDVVVLTKYPRMSHRKEIRFGFFL